MTDPTRISDDQHNNAPAVPQGWTKAADQVPLEADGEVFIRFTDGSIGTGWATYWHGASNEFARWTFPDPDEFRLVSEWAKNVPASPGMHWTENEPVRLPHARAGRVYLAGPMTGISELNFPAFNQEAERLRAEGLQVLNPADHGIVDGADWADYLRHDIAGLASCERIHLLRGWTKSKGACLEMTIAKALGMTVTYQVDAEMEHNNAPAVPQGYEIHEIPADYSGLVWLEGQVRAVARRAQAATGPQGWTDADSDAARLALELECLLMDTKDLSVVSKWWGSANDALELHRQRLAATPAPAPAVPDDILARACNLAGLPYETFLKIKAFLPVTHAPSQEPAVPQGWRDFLTELSKQKPEKPDYWSSCGQCERNSSTAEDLIAATPAPAPAQGEPFGYFRAEPFGWTDCSEDAEGAIALYEHPAKPAQEVGLTDEDVNAAAKVLAERFDYSWEHMPEEGRKNMRVQARAVVEAALRAKGGKHV